MNEWSLDQPIRFRSQSYLPGVGLFFVNHLIIAPILNQIKQWGGVVHGVKTKRISSFHFHFESNSCVIWHYLMRREIPDSYTPIRLTL